MGRFHTALFDLDGTLTDSGKGIINAVVYALEKMGINPGEREKLRSFVGPPLSESFREKFGLHEKEAEQAIIFYREYYRKTGLYENEVYPGIVEMLSCLQKKGIKRIVATSKPEPLAIQVLEHFSLRKYFDCIVGATFDAKREKKEDVIQYAISEFQPEDRKGMIMVGDRKHDIIGAGKNGISSLGVLYGYGSREELESAGADFLAENPLQVGEIICNQ